MVGAVSKVGPGPPMVGAVAPIVGAVAPKLGGASKLEAGMEAGGNALAFCCPPKIPLNRPLPTG